MKLKPLEQWICDTCGQVIESPADGYLEIARDENGLISDMCIVHQRSTSPIGNCYRDYIGSLPLTEVTGQDGLAYMLSLIDPGENFCEYRPRISNMRKVIDIFRRLHLPYYEEARLYWAEAQSENYWDGANEFRTYLPQNLASLCKYYRQKHISDCNE